MEPNNNNNRNFSSPQKQGVSQEYIRQRVFGERLGQQNHDLEEAQVQPNNRVENHQLLGRRIDFNNPQINHFPRNQFIELNIALNSNNLAINRAIQRRGYEESTVCSSNFVDSNKNSLTVEDKTNHFLSEKSEFSDLESLSFSDYEDRFVKPKDSDIEPRICKKVKSNPKSK